MAEMRPMPSSALDGIAPGRYGRADGAAGIVVSVLPASGLALVATRKGRAADVAAAVRDAFGVALPTTARRTENGGVAFVWSGPDCWLVHAAHEPEQGMEAFLAKPLAGCAAIVDQSHARVLVRISGARVRDALVKGVAVDLDPSAFRAGDTAITRVAHIVVQLWQADDAPTYIFAVARSLAGSFWDWLLASGAEHGLELTRTP